MLRLWPSQCFWLNLDLASEVSVPNDVCGVTKWECWLPFEQSNGGICIRRFKTVVIWSLLQLAPLCTAGLCVLVEQGDRLINPCALASVIVARS